MKNVVFYCARISSRDQNEGRQIEQLKGEEISLSNIIKSVETEIRRHFSDNPLVI
jgi:predicted site-specific integrase-resolvase